jgi:N-acetylglucosaminyl-diphospho-decaprenol L-rhamnosyltransferase
VKLSIVLVSYNSRLHLGKCLDSITRFAPRGTEVILVDNASSDGSAEFVEQAYPSARIVRNSRNLGFSAANNLAGKMVIGRFLLLLNADTVLVEPIAPAIEWLNEHPEFALLTINMLSEKGVPSPCTGKFPSPLRLILLRRMLVIPQQYGDDFAYEVDWVQGSFLLIKTEQWRALGGLDERYFMYVEDVDLCKRARNRGLKCAYLPHIHYIHSGGYNPRRFSEHARGLGIYTRTHMRGLRKSVSWVVLCIGCLARAAFFGMAVLPTGEEAGKTTSRASWAAFKALVHRSLSL